MVQLMNVPTTKPIGLCKVLLKESTQRFVRYEIEEKYLYCVNVTKTPDHFSPILHSCNYLFSLSFQFSVYFELHSFPFIQDPLRVWG